jgi:threonine dehydratase
VAIALADIRAAAGRIQGRVLRTPVRRSDWLSDLSGADVHLKLEIVQPTSSYKIRGAFNAALRVRERASPGELPRLVTASAGNHGRALAWAARALRLPLTVFIAAGAPRAKVDAIREAGSELHTCSDYDEAERHAKAYASAAGALFVSPYAHPDVIAGAGTIGLELFEDLRSIDTVVVPVGGGGLISGIGIAVKALSPATRLVGVEVAASCPFTKSLAAGRLVTIEVGRSLADGLTGNLDPDTITFDLVRELVDRIVVVDEPLLVRALAGTLGHEHLVVEGAAATGPAAVIGEQIDLKGNVVVVLTGANIDSDRLVEVLTGAVIS